MVTFLVVLNSIFILFLFRGRILFAIAFLGLLLWKLRYVILVLLVAWIGLLYYGFWYSQHAVWVPTVPVNDPALEWKPTPIATPQDAKPDLTAQNVQLDSSLQNFQIPVTGQPSSGPIPVTGQP